MKAIILAAGYATRLYPLTLYKPKALLPINNKPIIDYIVDELLQLENLDNIYVVTNHKFIDNFESWASSHESCQKISVLDDGTTSEENRLGAIGDIVFTINQKNINDELIIIAGDNFFTFSLKDYYDFYKKSNGDCICVKPYPNKDMLSHFGIAEIDKEGRLIGIEEKPLKPKSNLVVYASYIFKKETVPLFKKYIDEGNKPDAPGYFLEWLYNRHTIYAYKFSKECYDIGTPQSYKDVCNMFDNVGSAI